MEQRDLYDINRRLTGQTIFKGDSIPENNYIIVVLVFIQNSEGKFLIQKRSKIKNGKYATTGGHPKSGENSIQGIISEVKEEHFKRIELSDAIFVVNVNNYIGNSTNLEIEYAKKLKKEILYYTDKKKE